ncbi:MAG TPA: hypothetical protein DHW82_02500 [Spirochaetia bacterium]|nr:MAG: hypothetical protein A2Y41_07885 [Spirochaetes bacterium GWB1_36_13]HCL55863.1 hypothetical protein [Spirochaetia bacterium]
MFFNSYLFTLPNGKKGIGFKIPFIQVFNSIFISVFIFPSVRRTSAPLSDRLAKDGKMVLCLKISSANHDDLQGTQPPTPSLRKRRGERN